MHECQEIRSANINQKEDRFLIYERDLLFLYYASVYQIAIKENAVASTLSNMYVVAATLFTPIAALIFVKDWKEQHNKNLETDFVKTALGHLRKVEILEKQVNIAVSELRNEWKEEDFGHSFLALKNIDRQELSQQSFLLLESLKELEILTKDPEISIIVETYQDFNFVYVLTLGMIGLVVDRDNFKGDESNFNDLKEILNISAPTKNVKIANKKLYEIFVGTVELGIKLKLFILLKAK
ncbi:hypothetical protein HADU_03853 [Acinetobacter sp. HA]|uniref:hypothetical protein n=1 Tax=Acinetobacter sp. HA TaxID=1173062 RepID=UPI000263DDFF|nr:hypothetical protein [Acinetobacter sp. HA]EIM40049.1 hypothetical protein HADU_03853 [Acinetobacter sp. HA]